MRDYLKEILGLLIERYLEGTQNVSATLMKQCVRQDKTVFDEKALDALDPRYKQALWAMVKGKASSNWDSYQHFDEYKKDPKSQPLVGKQMISGGKRESRLDYVMNLADEIRFAGSTILDRKDLSRVIDGVDTLHVPVAQLTDKQLHADLARALGNVQVKLEDNKVIITDDFDFKGKHNSTAALLYEALSQRLRSGINTGALTNIGRVFCKEENGAATDSSIPVRIELDVKTMGGYTPPDPPSPKTQYGSAPKMGLQPSLKEGITR